MSRIVLLQFCSSEFIAVKFTFFSFSFSFIFFSPLHLSFWKGMTSFRDTRPKEKPIYYENICRAQLEDPNDEFLKLLRDSEGYASFLSFVTQEFCSENLIFWSEVESMRSLDSNSRVFRDKARRIFTRFIKEDGELAVGGISDSLRQAIETAVMSGKSTHATFDEAQHACFLTMKHSYPRLVFLGGIPGCILFLYFPLCSSKIK